MQKYGPGIKLNAEEALDPGILEWIIYDDFIVYRGPFFPIGRTPYFLGKIAATLPFEEEIDRKSLSERVSSLFEWYQTHDKAKNRTR